MKLLEFHARITKIMKKIVIPWNENHEIPIIPRNNNENHYNFIIPRQNHEHLEISRIQRQNEENHKK